ncbi:MAG TPA: segregation/condensation protein A [Planctomycetaceae bacterium]|nr:segregation/condensation protein A [Planctomycetaceae bacterium]
MEYKVQIDVFSGPLDLLLYLVRRQEVDIADLPIAAITAHFIEFIEVLEVLDLDLIGDFVVMASTLVEIKSRMVLPRPKETPETTTEEEDPRSDLVRQLIEYKKFKDAARLLEHQAAEWQERYPRLSDERPQQGGDPSSDRIKEVELWDLVSALSRVLRRNTASNPTAIVYDDTPISTYIERIHARVLAEGRVAFSELFEGTNLKSKIVGIFLAILELLRHYHLRAEQPVDFDEIWVLPPLEGDNANGRDDWIPREHSAAPAPEASAPPEGETGEQP